MKPYDIVRVRKDGYSFIGEAISYPTPEGTIVVRRVPGHPGTIEELPLSQVALLSKPARLRVHYAKVNGSGPFPIDMLRYDQAAPVNFRIDEDDYGRVKLTIDPSFGWDVPVVATARERPSAYVWTPERWSSFLWGLEEVASEVYTTN